MGKIEVNRNRQGGFYKGQGQRRGHRQERVRQMAGCELGLQHDRSVTTCPTNQNKGDFKSKGLAGTGSRVFPAASLALPNSPFLVNNHHHELRWLLSQGCFFNPLDKGPKAQSTKRDPFIYWRIGYWRLPTPPLPSQVSPNI